MKKTYLKKRFDRVVVISEMGKDSNGERRFLARCDCGSCDIFARSQFRNKHVACEHCEATRKTTIKQFRHKVCGRQTRKHKFCKSCKIILCDKGMEPEYKNSGYCKDCYKKNEKSSTKKLN